MRGWRPATSGLPAAATSTTRPRRSRSSSPAGSTTIHHVTKILEEKEATLKAKQKAIVAARKQLTEMAAQKQLLLTKLDGIEAHLKMIEATKATNEFDFDDSALARAKQSVADLEKRLEVLDRRAEMEGRFVDAGIPVSIEPGRDVVKEIDEEFGAAAPDPDEQRHAQGQESLIGFDRAARDPALSSRRDGPAPARGRPVDCLDQAGAGWFLQDG